jgi:hypothetical protein
MRSFFPKESEIGGTHGEMKNAYKILDHLGNLGIDGSTILK